MSGISTRLTLDDVQARAVLAGWMRAGEDLYDLMDPIGAALLGNVLDRFDAGRAPNGAAWPKSRRAAQEGGQTLVDSARLRNSMTFEPAPASVTVGSNVIYAAIHQFGGTIRAKSGGRLKFRVPGFALEGGGMQFRQVESVTLPPRPYLGIGPEDEDAIVATVEDWIMAPVESGAGNAGAVPR